MIFTVPNSNGERELSEFNTCHTPAGSPAGGQFCSKGGSASRAAERPQANESVQREANSYNSRRGLSKIDHTYVPLDQTLSGRIADAYEALPDDDRSPVTQRAYEALSAEVRAQWDHAVASGMKFLPWTKDGQPYQNSVEMADDVRANRRLYFFTGGDPNPLMAQIDKRTGLTINDMFRAIHDYYGHAAGGFGFGPRGEENAWRVHSQMFSRDAQRALTAETRGQNSWVNFGRHNYDAQGNYLNIPAAKRPYAKQKMALLPDEFLFDANRKTREADKPVVRKPAPEQDENVYRRPPKPKAH